MPIYYDLSHRIENGMTFYPGDPEPRIVPAEMDPPWCVTALHLGTHTGTHIDAASHYVAGGKTIDQYPPSRFILPGIVVPVPGLEDDSLIDWELLADSASKAQGGALIIRTGWDRFWKTERYYRHPFLSAEAANGLVTSGVTVVGIDALNVDSTARGTTHAHQALLGNDVLIVENLTGLDQLQPAMTYQFSFLPMHLAGLDGSPVRAIAWANP